MPDKQKKFIDNFLKNERSTKTKKSKHVSSKVQGQKDTALCIVDFYRRTAFTDPVY